jgi:hypothetical protein
LHLKSLHAGRVRGRFMSLKQTVDRERVRPQALAHRQPFQKPQLCAKKRGCASLKLPNFSPMILMSRALKSVLR